MEHSKISNKWPNALRWFFAQNLHSFTPWHFIQEPSELEGVAATFKREDIHQGEVFVFARRQDCDDFAGLEIINGIITDKVLHFHPTFSSCIDASSPKTWNIVFRTFSDVFEFVSERVIPNMKEWAIDEDASSL